MKFEFFKKIKSFFKRENTIPTDDIDAEIWKPVVGFEDKYCVSNLGNIKNLNTGVVGKGTLNSRGYYIVHLIYNGKDYIKSMHRLVAEAFYGEIPSGMIVDHINGDKLDNSVKNLKLTTRRGMKKDSPRVVHRYMARVVQLDMDGNEIKKFKNAHQAAIATKTSSSNIIAVCKNAYGRKSANGFKWKFEEDASLPF